MPRRVVIRKMPLHTLAPLYAGLDPACAAIRCGASVELVVNLLKAQHKAGAAVPPPAQASPTPWPTPLHLAVADGRSKTFVHTLCEKLSALDDGRALRAMLHAQDSAGRTVAALAVHMDNRRLPAAAHLKQPPHDITQILWTYSPSNVDEANRRELDHAPLRLRRALNRAAAARREGCASIGDEVDAACILSILKRKANVPLPLCRDDAEFAAHWVPRLSERVRLSERAAASAPASASDDGDGAERSAERSATCSATRTLVVHGHSGEEEQHPFESLMGCYVEAIPSTLAHSNRAAARLSARAALSRHGDTNLAIMADNAPPAARFWRFTGSYDGYDDVMLFYNTAQVRSSRLLVPLLV